MLSKYFIKKEITYLLLRIFSTNDNLIFKMINLIDNRVYFPENFKVILKKILWLLSNIIYKKNICNQEFNEELLKQFFSFYLRGSTNKFYCFSKHFFKEGL